MLSKSCVYAIRAALLVSIKSYREDKHFVPIRELAEELDLSFHFLTKILQYLTEAKIMESFRGPNGGVGLARPAAEISLLDIISAIDGTDMFSNCVLGLPGCGESTPCPLHEQWARKREDLRRLFERSNLAGLSRSVIAEKLRN